MQRAMCAVTQRAPWSARLRALSVHDQRVAIVIALTIATGVVDAVSYFSLDHVFTANMSGNMALLGIGVATNLGDVAGNIFAFAGFVLGSIAVGRFLRWRGGDEMETARHALLLQLSVLLLLTLVVGLVDVHEHSAWRFAVCLVLAAAMALQTGVARHLAVKDVNTTVATMTLHDLAAASRLAGGESERWKRRIGVVLALFVGAAVGTALDQLVRWGGLGLSALLVAGVVGAMAAFGASAPANDLPAV